MTFIFRNVWVSTLVVIARKGTAQSVNHHSFLQVFMYLFLSCLLLLEKKFVSRLTLSYLCCLDIWIGFLERPIANGYLVKEGCSKIVKV